ncbi:OprD family outer membrane porin [Sulfurospirillum sp. MES]|uniref:OprD family outer membrane porin n=1 Tax=Sulfurospirillum sp. MES TaxID=1565314 RepID=UPI000543007C|nr:OprD family outer membrane porin [Sulfurospirillum sp. MES]KHG35043.1 MAG: hypothetical protein OA34_02545 [Sulfurospirillum sp. MES]
MKLAKLSLAAMVVAGLASSSFAADTLADAFKQGSVNGELKAYYFTKDNGTNDYDILTTGVLLGYKTASFYGLSLGLTAQGSASPFASSDDKAAYARDMYGSGAQISEAYLAYSVGKTTAMVGRMFLDTPLVASSGSRVVKDSFEGAALINTDLPNTTLIAGYVQRYQDRTDDINGKVGDIGRFKKNFGVGSNIAYGVTVDDGAYTLAAINKSITGLTLTAAYANVVDIIQVAYAEAAYAGAAGKFTYGLSAQYYYNNLDSSVHADDNNLWGVKASVGYDAFGAYVAYTKVSDEQNGLGVVSGLGNGADLAYTMSPIMSTSYENDTEAYKIGVTYAVLKNANLGVNYTHTEISKTITDPKEENGYLAFEGDYTFEGALKGFTTSIIYEDGSKDASDANALWFKAGYKF